MNRREFIRTTAVASGAVLTGPLIAQGQGLKRAAVVIGIRETKSLVKLHSTIPGARSVADFLDGEDYEVRLHVDEAEPVDLSSIKRDVRELVSAHNLDQLLVYFSGHGIRLPHRGELWLLPHVRDDPDEAINLVECAEVCNYCGIPNIVFISDACRSRPDSLALENVTGSNIFPNCDGDGRADIDKFFAALPGRPSLEVRVEQSSENYKSLFTEAFLNAFRQTPDELILRLDDGLEVVPNERLEPYLVAETKRLAREHNVIQNVEPDADVPSADEVYIGRANRASVASWSPDNRPATDVDAYVFAFAEKGVGIASLDTRVSEISLARRVRDLGVERAGAELMPASDFDLRGAPAGIVVYGARVSEVGVPRGVETTTMDDMPTGASAIFGVAPYRSPAAGVVLVFEDESCAVISVFARFVTHVFVGPAGVGSVSFEPVPQDWPTYGDSELRGRLRRLRALANSATADGAFVFGGSRAERDSAAEALANKIRILKGYDPTLGILAAYAYSYARLPRQVASVHSIMRDDLGASIFDTELLVRRSRAEVTNSTLQPDATPFCPLLRPGWELLRVKGVGLAKAVIRARPYLRDSLWTSFDPPASRILLDALATGELEVTP